MWAAREQLAKADRHKDEAKVQAERELSALFSLLERQNSSILATLTYDVSWNLMLGSLLPSCRSLVASQG